MLAKQVNLLCDSYHRCHTKTLSQTLKDVKPGTVVQYRYEIHKSMVGRQRAQLVILHGILLSQSPTHAYLDLT